MLQYSMIIAVLNFPQDFWRPYLYRSNAVMALDQPSEDL